MALVHKGSAGSDDEDLECLRLAALQSLKRSAAPISTQTQIRSQNAQRTATFGSAQPTRHHNRNFRGANRTGRNGMFSRNCSRTNTNLISIQTVDSDSDRVTPPREIITELPKLILPQDRYHKKEEIQNENKEMTSNKFDRYDNSDESNSDSDADSGAHDREDSLERLMEELEDEINERKGKPNTKKPKKEVISDKSKSDNTSNCDNDSDCKVIDIKDEGDSILIIECENELVQDELLEEEIEEKVPVETTLTEPPVYSRLNKRKTPIRDSPARTFSRRRNSRSRSPKRPRYESRPIRRDSRSPPRKMPYSSPDHKSYIRALSPLTINTEVLSSMTRAPLSPRSAAFVLQNREILARRKMSPRKSLSPRHSLSPRRPNISPRRRSRSPWFDYSHKRSLSPRCRSPRSFSPRRRSMSPRNRPRRSPLEDRRIIQSVKKNSRSPVPKQPVHKRLGTQRISPLREKKPEPSLNKGRSNRSMSLSLSPSPDRSYNKQPLNDTTGIIVDSRRNRDVDKTRRARKDSPEKKPEVELNPVLEARRRKFENPIPLSEGNGIIKLKINKKENEETVEKEKPLEEEEEEEGELEEDKIDEGTDFLDEYMDDLIELNPTADDLWSDEQSDSENEGRFKSSNKTEKRTVTYLPFSKLTEKPVPAKDSLSNVTRENVRNPRRDIRKRSSIPRKRSPMRSRSRKDIIKPKENKVEKEKDDKHIDVKSKVRIIDQNNVKPSENKIRKEIHAKENVEKIDSKPAVEEIRRVKVQKVEVPERESPAKEDDDTEIIIDNEDDDDTEVKDDGGDLRAELSRRRAQRLYKAGSLADVLPTRLLKTALKEVGMKRCNKHPKVEKSAVASTVDRRVLVLKRLVDNPEPELDNTHKELKKEGKLPIHMRLGITSSPDQSLEEMVRADRRKRSRSGRRKRVVQV